LHIFRWKSVKYWKEKVNWVSLSVIAEALVYECLHFSLFHVGIDRKLFMHNYK
jgi:hypothetical protein